MLIPKEALDEVIAEYHFFNDSKMSCSLSKCCYGSFLAKEIEEMGLSLPHSDLVQLSCMHYPSYARTLWRHHGRTDSRGLKGRILILLLELGLKEGKISDASFISCILQEIVRVNLPRTMLLACECLVNFEQLSSICATPDDQIRKCILLLTKRLTKAILGGITDSSNFLG